VLAVARAARAAGVERFVLVSSVGAAISGKTLYLRVKGEVEQALGKLGFRRLDFLQPGLLRGARGELRALEKLAMVLSPLTDLLLQGQWRRFRSIPASTVARAALAATVDKPGGRFAHEHDGILRLARKLEQPE
ncbi:MAG: nucleoside-diphosphate sugar epimerase, partial [Croceibacterium sp.]